MGRVFDSTEQVLGYGVGDSRRSRYDGEETNETINGELQRDRRIKRNRMGTFDNTDTSRSRENNNGGNYLQISGYKKAR